MSTEQGGAMSDLTEQMVRCPRCRREVAFVSGAIATHDAAGCGCCFCPGSGMRAIQRSVVGGAESGYHIHTYPVDPSMTAEEAWRELCLMGVRATYTGTETWASIRCDGQECEGIAEADARSDQSQDVREATYGPETDGNAPSPESRS